MKTLNKSLNLLHEQLLVSLSHSPLQQVMVTLWKQYVQLLLLFLMCSPGWCHQPDVQAVNRNSNYKEHALAQGNCIGASFQGRLLCQSCIIKFSHIFYFCFSIRAWSHRALKAKHVRFVISSVILSVPSHVNATSAGLQ